MRWVLEFSVWQIGRKYKFTFWPHLTTMQEWVNLGKIKLGKGNEQTLLKRQTSSQWTWLSQRMLIIPNHQKNANQCKIPSVLFSMATTKKLKNNKFWLDFRENEMLIHCWWECKLVQPLWKAVWRFFKEFKTEVPFNQQFHYWVYIQKKMWNSTKRNPTCTCTFIILLFTLGKT